MSAAAALAQLNASGVRVRLRDDGTVALDASGPPPAAVLAFARAHREDIAALLRDADSVFAPGSLRPVAILAGVPRSWCEGVARLVTMVSPDTIEPARWATLAATSDRLLRFDGATLHAAGWDALDLFGLQQRAPSANAAGWGLAWLLRSDGEVLNVTPDTIIMRRSLDGARLGFRRACAAARAGVVPAWALSQVLT